MKPRNHLEALSPYKPIEPHEVLSMRHGLGVEEIIKLDANENPYGPLPAVRQALATFPHFNLYPDSECRSLRQSLSTFLDMPMDSLIVGAGADELIDLLIRVLVEPGECVLNCPPTFGMYEFHTQLNGGRLIEQPRRDDFSLDVSGIRRKVLEHRPKLLFLATPNNPDGSMPSAETLDEILDLPTLVVLDEAYIEFADELGGLGKNISRIRQVPKRKNLVVLRTFSKWAGLAGLRIGYGAFPEWLIPILWKSKQPYNVNIAAITAASISLQHLSELAQIVSTIVAERQKMAEALKKHPFLSIYPSHANYLLVKVKGIPAAELQKRLMVEFGIFVRYFNSPRLQDCIRISVGRPQDTEALIYAIDRIGEEID